MVSNGEISYSRMIELMNEKAFHFYKSSQPASVVLPTDEEINKKYPEGRNDDNRTDYDCYRKREGAIWMRDKIQSQLQSPAAKQEGDIEAIDKWISIYERLPEFMYNKGMQTKMVLGASRSTWAHEVYARKINNEIKWFNVYGDTLSYITHWMPLPESPKK